MIKDYQPANIRNIALIGHGSTGKTTLTEAILFAAGAIKEKGSVERGNAVSDFDEEEVKRNISIKTSISSFEYADTKINLIDIPGSSDFIAEAISGLRIADAAILLIDAESGVQIQTEKMWDLCSDRDIPVLAFVNKMDKEHANFEKTIGNIKDTFNKSVAVLQLPIGSGNSFKGTVDLLNKKALLPKDNGKDVDVQDIPSDMADSVESINETMVESLCEANDTLIDKFLEGEEISNDELVGALKDGLKNRIFIPVIAGNAIETIGVKPLLDTIISSFPTPLDSKTQIAHAANDKTKEIEVTPSESDPFSAFVFKTQVDQYAGKVSYMRVISGKLKVNEEIVNARTQTSEKVSHIYTAKGKDRVDQDSAVAGDIIVMTKLADTTTSDTITNSSRKLLFNKLALPQPISFTAIGAENRQDSEKLIESLLKISEEDPSFKLEFNAETKEYVISCMGELQTDIALSRVTAKIPNLKVIRRTPKVAYRETIKKPASARYRHKKQTGGHGQFGECELEISPLQRNAGYEFQDNIVGGVIPKNFIPGVEKGVVEALEAGVLAGYPVCDVKVRLYDGKYHDVDSSELAFKIAARTAVREAMKKADAVLLEPIMKVKVFVAEPLMGNVMNDLNGKRGRVLGMDKVRGDTQCIEALVPLSEMLRYSIDLKASTSGQATFEMEFDHYEEITGKLAENVIAESKAAAEQEE